VPPLPGPPISADPKAAVAAPSPSPPPAPVPPPVGGQPIVDSKSSGSPPAPVTSTTSGTGTQSTAVSVSGPRLQAVNGEANNPAAPPQEPAAVTTASSANAAPKKNFVKIVSEKEVEGMIAETEGKKGCAGCSYGDAKRSESSESSVPTHQIPVRLYSLHGRCIAAPQT